MLEDIFHATIALSDGRVVPVRFVGEQHGLEAVEAAARAFINRSYC